MALTYLRCSRCRKTVPVKNELPLEATCTICGHKIRNTSKQIEDLATGTFGIDRQG
jgi:DNA-directed RNA polymerase subunit RPC12/RpoP